MTQARQRPMPRRHGALATLAIGCAMALAATTGPAQAAGPDKAAVLTTYADIAKASYGDSLIAAQALRAAVDRLANEPSQQTLQAARSAWLAARVPYQQSEAFRFGNPLVDDWEGKVNAWPLDEGLIDYVDGGYGTESDENPFYVANVIANPNIRIGGSELDASTIDIDLLRKLHEIDSVEANVATGYHAIEFLLWGQDLNGTGPGAGNRPFTDFSSTNCTGGNCARRTAYLKATTALLVSDLQDMAAKWGKDGEARKEVLSDEADAGIGRILTGIGSLSYGELAGERMRLGLILHDPEEEHDCFSDNTHNSHFYDALGIRNVYLGSYTRIDGSVVKGPSVSAIVAAVAPEVDAELRRQLDATQARMQAIVDSAGAGVAYDQLLAQDNPTGNALIEAAVEALRQQTRSIERAVAQLGLQPLAIEGSDSLDSPDKIKQ